MSNTERRIKICGRTLLGTVGCAWLLVACASRPPAPSFPRTLPAPEVRLGPGDLLDVRFVQHTDLNEQVRVRPDGKVSLPMVDDVDVAGLTPAQLDAKLTARYASEVNRPNLSVIVRELADQHVFVGGEVRQPGVVAIRGTMGVLEAIIAAGGFANASAKLSDIVLIRYANGKRHATKLDLRRVLRGELTDQVCLAPLDVVYVTRTRISRLNQWIDQYIEEIIPVTRLRVLVPVGEATVGYGY